LFGIGGAGGGGRILAEALERGLTGLGVKFAVIDDLEPGEERLIELG
jgi:hypothetical protein